MIRIIALALMFGTAAQAQVYSLSPQEKADAIESASRRPDADNPALLPELSQDRRPHGEVGAMVGTGGARGVYGVMGVPIGESGSASFAFSNTRMPGYYGYSPYGAQSRFGIGLGLRQPGW